MKDIEPSEKETPASDVSIDAYHVSVLAQELIAGLAVRAGGRYLDATLGGGGHTSLILAAAPDVTVVAIDRDEQAIRFCQSRFANSPVEFWHGNFAEYQSPDAEFDGIIADLGVSSAQFDKPERGFSFRHPAQLDMRMNQQQSLTAEEIINHWEIVAQRPFETTTELAGAIASTFPPKQRNGRIHPATRTFQALRIAVNSELASLETFLNQAPKWLKPGGRIGIITFHSLEDRPVKHQLRATECLQVLTKKPIVPQSDELARNPRSRSAKLRLAEKLT
ncbi:MAG: 16S rRNA (cytosine(1402)-N(4))-methyltransferase [Oscillatoriales cyanobacterium]|nr:MAG: 16S rRNA (cytosine(1402)-N(4))-methyltransferase [Oscillatoriales cyanobacterium]